MEKENMKKNIFGFIICALLLIVTLSACNSNRFPTGLFSNLTINHCVLKLNKNHTWTNEVYGFIVSSGTYSIQDNLFILRMNPVNDATNTNVFIYEWSYEDDILTLKLLGNDGYPEQFRHVKADLALSNIHSPNWIGVTQQISKWFHILKTLVNPLLFIRQR